MCLIMEQVKQSSFPHFRIIKSLPIDAKLGPKYSTQLCSLKAEFDRRSVDFKSLDNDFHLIAAPFSLERSKILA